MSDRAVREWAEDVLNRLHEAELAWLRLSHLDDPQSIAALEKAAIEDRRKLNQAIGERL